MSNKLKKLLFTLVITLLALPSFGGSVLAADSEEINFIILKDKENDTSSMSTYLSAPATISTIDGITKVEFNFTGASMIKELSVQDYDSKISRNEDGKTGTLELTVDGELPEYSYMDMVIDTGSFGPGVMEHTVRVFFGVEDISEVSPELLESTLVLNNETETPKEEPKEEENEDKDPVEESTVVSLPDNATFIKLVSKSPAVSRQFDNPAIVFEHDGKTMIQMSGTGGQFIESLTINGEEVTWGDKNKDGSFFFQFEHPGNLSKALDFGMVIVPPFGDKMEHEVDLAFDENIKRDFRKPEVIEVSLGVKAPVKYLDTVNINNGDAVLSLPYELPEGVELKVTSQDPTNIGNLEVAGGVYEFDFTNLGNFKGQFSLVMDYDAEKFKDRDIDIYYYDESDKTWKKQNATARNGKISFNPTHFSTYGVFAPPVEEESESDNDLVPDKATQIEYTILQSNSDEVSASMNFMDSTAVLLEKNGVKYLQISTEAQSGQYIKSLRVKLGDSYQEMVVVERTDDGRTIFQLKVEGELSDVILLDMIIDVKGVYENQHHYARLILDPETSVELDASNYLLVASTNDNGPDGENAVDPEAAVKDLNGTEEGGDQNTDVPEVDETPVPTVIDGNPTNNPQTGENSNLLLLTLLLIGSGSVIAYTVRKRLVA
ncbi:NEAT domain-containing protein [Oceanobacillus sp. CAU 1775]